MRQSLQSSIRRRLHAAGDEAYKLAASGQDPNRRLASLEGELRQVIEEQFETTRQWMQSDMKGNEAIRIRMHHFVVNSASAPEAAGSAEVAASAAIEGKDQHPAGAIADLLKIAPLIAAPPPLKVWVPIVVAVVEQLIQVFARNKRLEQENERLRQQADASNRRQQEALQQQIMALQELGTQIRLGLFKTEEEVMRSVEESIEELFQPLADSVELSLKESRLSQAALQHDLSRVNSLLGRLELFRASLI